MSAGFYILYSSSPWRAAERIRKFGHFKVIQQVDHEEPAAPFQSTSTVPVSEASGGVRSQDPAQEFPDTQDMVDWTQGSQSPGPRGGCSVKIKRKIKKCILEN